MSYSGPDGDANVSGTCTDRAGHTSAPRAFGFKYDDTAPESTKAEVKKGDHFVTLSWAATGGVAAVTVTRADLAAERRRRCTRAPARVGRTARSRTAFGTATC